jgi:S-DNA-T family DNA segregation ATPase FtsK/SpoIIIE
MGNHQRFPLDNGDTFWYNRLEHMFYSVSEGYEQRSQRGMGDSMKRMLNYQADRIEVVLSSHKVQGHVTGGRVTPRYVRFDVATPYGTPVRRVEGLSEELAMALGAPNCRVYRDHGQIEVEVPREKGQAVSLLPLCRRLVREGPRGGATVPPCTAILGVDSQGVPLLLRLPSADVAHVLIAGTTGSGKTALARTMVVSLALHNRPSDLQLVLIDPKRRGFQALEGLPHLLVPVLGEVGAAVDTLERLVREMERRDQQGRDSPRVAVVVDELADLLMQGGRPAEAALTRLTQRGREAGIHIVGCTQKPTAAVIGSLVKSNFPIRLVGSVSSPEDAKVAAGLAGTGAERLLGRGDFVLVAKGQTTRFQAAYVAQPELREIVERLREHGRSGAQRLLASGAGGDGATRASAGSPALATRMRTKLRLVKAKRAG